MLRQRETLSNFMKISDFGCAFHKKHHVIITEGQSNRARIARVIASATGESLEKAAKRLAQFPVDIAFSTKSEAVKFAKDVTNAGGKATIKTS